MHVGKAFMIKVSDDPHMHICETLRSPSEALCHSKDLLKNKLAEDLFSQVIIHLVIIV